MQQYSTEYWYGSHRSAGRPAVGTAGESLRVMASERVALIIVDVQHDFVYGSMAIAGASLLSRFVSNCFSLP